MRDKTFSKILYSSLPITPPQGPENVSERFWTCPQCGTRYVSVDAESKSRCVNTDCPQYYALARDVAITIVERIHHNRKANYILRRAFSTNNHYNEIFPRLAGDIARQIKLLIDDIINGEALNQLYEYGRPHAINALVMMYIEHPTNLYIHKDRGDEMNFKEFYKACVLDAEEVQTVDQIMELYKTSGGQLKKKNKPSVKEVATKEELNLSALGWGAPVTKTV